VESATGATVGSQFWPGSSGGIRQHWQAVVGECRRRTWSSSEEIVGAFPAQKVRSGEGYRVLVVSGVIPCYGSMWVETDADEFIAVHCNAQAALRTIFPYNNTTLNLKAWQTACPSMGVVYSGHV
jgi:hypothetical protein